MEPWQRTLTVAAVAQVFAIVGFSFIIPFLPLYVQTLGIHGAAHVTLWAGLLSGGSAIAMAVTAPIWGVLADRHGRKIMVARSMLSAALIIGLMAVVQNVWELLALRMLQGAFSGTVSASQALIASQVPKRRLGFALGIMQTAIFIGNSFGPLVGGLVADSLGFRASIGVAACSLFAGGLMVAFFITEDRSVLAPVGAERLSFGAGIVHAARLPGLAPMIASVFGVQFALSVVFPVLPQYIQSLQGSTGHAASATGIILALAGVAGALSSLSVGFITDRVGYRAVLVGAAAAAAVLSVPQYWAQSTVQIGVLRVLIEFAVGAMMPSASALIASRVPQEDRGTAYGLSGSATSLGFGSGPLTAAAVVSVAGMRPVFLTAAFVLGGIALWVRLKVSNVEPVPAAGTAAGARAAGQ